MRVARRHGTEAPSPRATRWLGSVDRPTAPGPACAGPAPAASTPGPEPSAPRSYAEAHAGPGAVG
eukprot:5729913-Lingulodinium_polyedra.AAC.1